MTTSTPVERTSDDGQGFADTIDRVIAGLVFRYRPAAYDLTVVPDGRTRCQAR